jgi:hypothetical protein
VLQFICPPRINVSCEQFLHVFLGTGEDTFHSRYSKLSCNLYVGGYALDQGIRNVNLLWRFHSCVSSMDFGEDFSYFVQKTIVGVDLLALVYKHAQ